MVSSPDCGTSIFSLKYTNITNTEYLWSGEFPQPSFPPDFHWSQYINFRGRERERYHRLHQMIQHFRYFGHAVPCHTVTWQSTVPVSGGRGCPMKHDHHFRTQREENNNTSWACSGHRLTRMLSRDISLNPTQPPSATNSGPYATGWENEVRLSKRPKLRQGRRDRRA